MVNVADKTRPRSLASQRDLYQTSWTRRLHLTVPVYEPDRWSSTSVLEGLTSLLRFLTGDFWEFDFVPRNAAQSVEQLALIDTLPAKPFRVVLFSGGLDSTAGICSELRERPDQTLIAVSARSSTRVGAVQKRLCDQLRNHCRSAGQIIPIGVPYNLVEARPVSQRVELIQRSRGFIYLALGAVTALAVKADSLQVFENGIGALNLPYTDSQIGSHSMRAMHPETLLRMEKFVSALVDHPFRVYNPFQWLTKAEVCGLLGHDEFRDLVAMTISCERFPRRVRGKPQCGLCTSCLLRRQALYAAGLEGLDCIGGYQYSLMAQSELDDPSRLLLFPLWAMLNQVEALRRCIDSPNAWGALVTRFPELAIVAEKESGPEFSMEQARRRILRLYQAHVAEWDVFRSSFPLVGNLSTSPALAVRLTPTSF